MLVISTKANENRLPGNRPRDPEKKRLISELDKARFDRYIASGKLQIINLRHWKWRIDFRQISAGSHDI